jgi:hypothetical protein
MTIVTPPGDSNTMIPASWKTAAELKNERKFLSSKLKLKESQPRRLLPIISSILELGV